jgi:transglutaminase-like putative cysteine protease
VVCAETSAGNSVERFFQLSLLGLVASGYLAVTGSGYLDTPTVVLTAVGLLIRVLWICGLIRLEISERTTNLVTVAYAVFFVLDYLLLSRDFLSATVHLLFFLAVMKILTARTNRDYLYTAIIAFLELLAAAILSVNFNFILFLSLYLLFAIAALTAGEIRRSTQKCIATTTRTRLRSFSWRLALLSTLVTAGILAMTAGLFFILPRTAEAAFSHLIAHRIYLPGFSNQVTLGEIGEIKTSSRPVMHIRVYSAQPVGPLKWRGGALTEFDGKRWTNPRRPPEKIDVQNDHIDLVPISSWIAGHRINYHVDLEALENDALFFAGTPETVDIRARALYRYDGSVYRLGRTSPQGLRYDAYSRLEDRPELAPPMVTAVLPLSVREPNLQLPAIDPRIADLARSFTAGATNDLERVRAIERRLRTGYGYTLELPDREVADPLAHFLFTRKQGHCEYFASSMAVMLRSIGVPARLATGFQGGVYNSVTELWLIRAGDAHSWVEAWIPGHGWTTFDPTPPDPNAHSSLAFLTHLALYLDAAETFWQEWVVTYDLTRQGSLAGRIEQGAHQVGARWGRSLASLRALWTEYVILGGKRFGAWLLGVPTGLLLFWVLARKLLQIVSLRQRVERVRRGQASVADATLLYQRMLQLLKRRGYQKPPWFTPSEFAASLPATELGRTVGEFTATYNALRFGRHTHSSAQLSVLLDRMERNQLG